MSNRITYLDGLRGLAILSVLLFHAYSRWGQESGGEIFEQDPIAQTAFSVGHQGVLLFFAISGFVIFKTLLATQSYVVF